jgi:CubicO group peptidase (beta-lactamase class C family)
MGARSKSVAPLLVAAWLSGPVQASPLLAPADCSASNPMPDLMRQSSSDTETDFPFRVVRRGDSVRGLPVAARQISPHWTWQGRDWTLESYMRRYSVSGVMVLKDGEILLERYGLGRNPTDRWTSESVAKSVTSLLAGAAIEDGKLRLDDPIERFVPELAASAYDGVTVRQLLTMSSGAAWVEDYADPNSDLAKFYDIDERGGDALIETLRRLPRAHPPGTTFHYNTVEAHLAGLVISRAVGTSLSEYLSKKIWRPFGMESDALWRVDRKGREVAGCCLAMTLADYARIGEFALENGAADGKPVTPPGWIAQSTSVQIANGRPAPFGYGYFWWIGPEAYEASGIFGQSILVYPKDRIVIVVNSAWPKADAKALFEALGAFQKAVRAAVAAAPEAAPK